MAVASEVIEHVQPSRLAAFERALFETTRPGVIVITTPNVEYNQLFRGLDPGELRHTDHRFEWSRAEFQAWALGVAERFGYRASFNPVGPEDRSFGPPTQMGVFES